MQIDTLKKILNEKPFCPEILMEEDGDLGLDWCAGPMVLTVSISDEGTVAWAYINGGIEKHGTDLGSVIEIINSDEFCNRYMDLFKSNRHEE